MQDLSQYSFSQQPNFNEPEVRIAFSKAVPLKTIVIYCYDPRAAGIPDAVACLFPDEVFPGKLIVDEDGKKVASTTSIFPVIVAGGRAVDALRSITVAQHLFGITNVIVVHHSHCGATSFTAKGIVEAFKQEHGVDISSLYQTTSICISDYEISLRGDVGLIRHSLGTARHINIYGCFYDIDSHTLIEVLRDEGAQN
jgi:carbonic anhydrase